MIEDYSNFQYTLGKRPTKKEWEKLQRKLTTYVDSNKFLRQGSTVDQYDQVTGKRVKRPIYNVTYKKDFYDQQGIPAQIYRNQLKLALKNKNKKAIRNLLQYDTYAADKFVTLKQQQQLADKKRRGRILLTSVLLGGTGALLGIVPYIEAKKEGRQKDPNTIRQIINAAGIGAGLGITTTGLIELFRD